MHIVFGVSEIYPLIKVGGLGDFAGSFTEKLGKLGHKVSVVVPGYRSINREAWHAEDVGIRFTIPIGDSDVSGHASRIGLSDRISIYLIENEKYYDREYLFGTPEKEYEDNAERFLFFSRAILELADHLGDVDVLHMNDWHTAIALFYLKEFYWKMGKLTGVRSVLTIHNLGYQGLFWHHDVPLLNMGWEFYTPASIEFYDHINYLKSGIVYADVVATVSPSYAREIQTPEFGFGLDGVLRSRSGNLCGILNGVDYRLWNPWFDKEISVRYSARTFARKQGNKAALQKEMAMNVNPDVPMITMISRLNSQKGVDLILPVFDMMMELGIQFVLLGTGKPAHEQFFKEAEGRHKGSAICYIGYDEALAHRIYAAGDIYLMPSRYEPCGLSQLYAMKYGNVPLVRMVGGLRDTVVDLDEGPDCATGFGFEYYSPYTLYETVRNAVTLFREDRTTFNRIGKNGMAKNFSWTNTVKEYLKLYQNGV